MPQAMLRTAQFVLRLGRVSIRMAPHAESVLGRWKPTGWSASPFREIENVGTQREGQCNAKALQDAAKGTRSISSFFPKPAQEVGMPDED